MWSLLLHGCGLVFALVPFLFFQGNLRWPNFLQYKYNVLGKSNLFSFARVTATDTVGMGSSPPSSMPLISSSFLTWDTNWSYEPFSRYAKLNDVLKCGSFWGKRKRSIICWAFSTNACSAYSCNTSKKSESDFPFGLKVSLSHLCWAVARESSLTYFLRNTMSAFSGVILLVALILRNVCNASVFNCASKLLIFLPLSIPVAFWTLYGRGIRIVRIFPSCHQTILCLWMLVLISQMLLVAAGRWLWRLPQLIC